MPELAPAPKSEIEQVEMAERILSASGAVIKFDSPGKAFYMPVLDEIHSAPRDTYRSTEDYYSTLLHELGHWTGHADRLDREAYGAALRGSVPKDVYAKEELRAEIASYFLAMDTGISVTEEHLKNHAAYVASWLEVLKKDKNEIYRAAKDAEQICGYLTRGLELGRGEGVAIETERVTYGVLGADGKTEIIFKKGGIEMTDNMSSGGYERKTIDVAREDELINRNFDSRMSNVLNGWVKDVKSYVDEKKGLYRADFKVMLKAPDERGSFPEKTPFISVSHVAMEPFDLSVYEENRRPIQVVGQKFFVSPRDRSTGKINGDRRLVVYSRSIHEAVMEDGKYKGGLSISAAEKSAKNELVRAGKEFLSGYVYAKSERNIFNEPLEGFNKETGRVETYGFRHKFSINTQMFKDGRPVLDENGKPKWEWVQVEAITTEKKDPVMFLSTEESKKKLSLRCAFAAEDYADQKGVWHNNVITAKVTKWSVYRGKEQEKRNTIPAPVLGRAGLSKGLEL